MSRVRHHVAAGALPPLLLLLLLLAPARPAAARHRGAQPAADTSVQRVASPGLNAPMLLLGSDAKSAANSYVDGLLKQRVFVGHGHALRRWARRLDATAVRTPTPGRRPVVGIQFSDVRDLVDPHGKTSTTEVRRRLASAVRRAGGDPVFLPPAANKAQIKTLLGHIDHLVVAGGADIAPSLYGKRTTHARATNARRDRYEAQLLRTARAQGIGIDAICRGMQFLNVISGGTLHQDLTLDNVTGKSHRGPWYAPVRHVVHLDGQSAIAKAAGATRLVPPSSHHQAVARLGRGLRVVGRGSDGVVEAIESHDGKVRGYQFHPELSRSRSSRALFRNIVSRARVRMRSRQRGLSRR